MKKLLQVNAYRPSYIRTFINTLVFTIAILSILIYINWRYYRTLGEIVQPKSSLVKIVGTISLLDEALTMSAYMAAATGDPQWENRYLQLNPQLDTAIQQAKQVAPNLFTGDAARQTDKANTALVKMEKDVFELVRHDQRISASAILSSPEYKMEKQAYREGFQQMQSALNNRDMVLINTERRNLLMSLIVSGAMLPLLLFAWATVLKMIRKYSSEQKKAEETLIQAKEKAEESDRLKSAFLANMSHEIRTPMNGVLGFAGLLKEPNLTSEEQQEYVSIIEEGGARMLNIINDLIDISKIESGLMNICMSRFNINEQIEYLYNFFRPEVEGKGVKFSFKNSLHSNQAIIKTDTEKINAILTNLVKNAIKFTNEGSIVFGYEKKGMFLEFFVKDTGVGISNEQKKVIFERFRQGSESLTRNYEGAGLGLSISKSYVEMLEGKIWVEDNPDSYQGTKGSVFYFTIPYNVEQADLIIVKNIVSDDGGKYQAKNLNILIVEDDEISTTLITKMIRIYSKEVLIVRTGIEAVETCRNNPTIDMVLMDIKIPILDGYEATRQIRQFNKDLVIIAQTAYALTGEKETAIKAGCNDYISKPIKKAEFLAIIKKYFKN
jgi:signal transduction histidine kinase